MTFWEFKQATEKYKKAVGKEAKEVPQEIIDLKKQIKDAERELEKAKASGSPEPIIEDWTTTLGTLRYRLRQLLIARETSQ